MVYPLSGYFADVWCGRYKASLVLLCVALATSILLCGSTIIWMTKSWRVQHFGLGCSIPFGVLLILMFITIILSFSCYQANIIQLGLDQLLEASGEKLSHFIHWLMWHTRWEVGVGVGVVNRLRMRIVYDLVKSLPPLIALYPPLCWSQFAVPNRAPMSLINQSEILDTSSLSYPFLYTSEQFFPLLHKKILKIVNRLR